MNQLDLDYQNLIKDILENGIEKNTRNGKVLSVFGRSIRHNFKDGKFPLLTTKKMAWKQIVTELLWFLRGDTNIKYLVENGCHIWDGDAYKRYLNEYNPYNNREIVNDDLSISNGFLIKEEFINKIKTDDEFAKTWGELGPIYGRQWRSWSKHNWIGGNWSPKYDLGKRNFIVESIDQIANLISELKTNPDSRRLMVNAWNVGEIDKMTLPPCHYGFQVYTRELSEREIWDYIHKNKIKILHQHAVLFGHEVGSELRKTFIPTLKKNYNIPTRAISLMFNMRSTDVGLGLSFNLASYGLLLMMIAKQVNMIPDELIYNGGDVHLYANHIEPIKEQLTRQPYPLPTVKISDREINDISEYNLDDILLENYQSHPSIKLPLSN